MKSHLSGSFRILTLLCFGASLTPMAWGEAPAWAISAAAQPTPKLEGHPPAVVLLDETAMEVNERGLCTQVHRGAIRILDTTGARWATAKVHYLDKTDRVRNASAWLVRKGDTYKSKNTRDWDDLSLTPAGAVYGEIRAKVVDLKSETAEGDVFAFETSLEQPLLIAQLRYVWGWDIPVVRETCRVCVPAGFKIEPILHGENPPTATSTPDQRCSTWEVRDQPYRLAEPFAPDLSRSAPDLMVTITPPPQASRGFPRNFRSWTEVTEWAEALSAGQCDSAPALAEAAHQLTQGCTDPLAKIRALGSYVQKLRYVALDTNLGKGDGYKPRKASQVFTQGYGDCKDKANLLQAMLKEVGITSYPVLAHAASEIEIWPDFPSPEQFDHAILGIVVADNIQLPSVVTDAANERLLIFDPTDPFTQVGDLSNTLQGARVHVLAKGSDSLVLLPRIPEAEGHLVVRKAKLQLSLDGSIQGNVSVHGTGQSGAALRFRLFQASQPKELDELISSLLGESLKGSKIQNGKREDDLPDGCCGVSFEFSNPKFLQPLPNGLTIARLDVMTHAAIPTFAAKERKLPVKLNPLAQSDEVVLELPAGFTIEELPKPATVESAYGRYQRSYEARGTGVVLTRRLELKAQIVPSTEYASLRAFFSEVGKAERAAVLLKHGA